MMRLPQFGYRVPSSLDDAVRMLADDPNGTRLVAGGTDLWPNLKRRHQSARTVVSLRRIQDLRGVEETASGELRIGAMTPLSDLCIDPRLKERAAGFVRAVASISSPVLRNMGTLGGNLCLDTRCTYYNQNEEWRRSIGYCMKEVGETCWVAPSSPRCWAIQASDGAPALCALGARVRLVSVRGERTIGLEELYRDDGIAYLAKEPDEILTHVFLSPSTPRASTYWKLRRRGSIDFPVLGVGASVNVDARGEVSDARLFLGAVGSYPVNAKEASSALLGGRLDEASIEQASLLAAHHATPLDNTDFTLHWRREMITHYVRGALQELSGRAPSILAPPHGQWAFAV